VNSRLPRDIVVRSAAEVAEDFHASRSAVGKTYLYRVYVGPVRPAMLAGRVYHFYRTLDVEAMRAGADRLAGRHDFRGFATSADPREDTVRTIHRCSVAQEDGEVRLTVQGDGFLYNMVRNIAGTLIEVGRGRWKPEQVDRVLASRNRADAGPTAPPDGLYLMCVHY